MVNRKEESTLPVAPLDWSKLRRQTPDPRAATSISDTAHRILSGTVTFLTRVLVLPIYGPFLVLRHITRPAPFPEWTLSRMWAVRTGKLVNRVLNLVLGGRFAPQVPHVLGEPAPYQQACYRDLKDVRVDLVGVPPVEEEMRVGVGVCEGVQTQETVGVMLSPDGAAGQGLEEAAKGERIVYHIHGGGFTRGYPLWQELPLATVRVTRLRMLSIDYRKTISPSTAFPAPLLDALSGYLYLINELHFSPCDIILAGESAGGHIALLLSRYLSTLNLPAPGYMILMAPWSDPTCSFPSYARLDEIDTLLRSTLLNSARTALQWYTPEGVRTPEYSPALHGPEAWGYLREAGTKVFMIWGSRELFVDECTKVAESMREAGVDLVTRVDVDGLHTQPIYDQKRRVRYLGDVCKLLGIEPGEENIVL